MSKIHQNPRVAVSTFMRTNPNVTLPCLTGRRSDAIKQVRGIQQDLRERWPGQTRSVLLTTAGWQYLVWHFS